MIYVIGPNVKISEDIPIINTTSRALSWSKSLSPFYCGPIDLYDGYVSINFENAWQFSKVYEYYVDNGEPGDRYFNWAKNGWNDVKAHRYPMGKGVAPLYSYWAGEKLSYIDARKKIYIPLYSKAVQKTSAFEKLKKVYESNKDIALWDFDAHNLISGTFDYLKLWDNPNIKIGHAYVLAMLLENII